MGVAHSVKKYGYDDPAIVFSDDPVKVSDIIQSLISISIQDKALIYSAFPSLSQNLTSMAVAYGQSALELPDSIEVIWLSTSDLVESTFSSLMSPLDVNP